MWHSQQKILQKHQQPAVNRLLRWNKYGCRLYFVLLLALSLQSSAAEQSDPLPSWQEGKTKSSILQFVKEVTDEHSSSFVPIEERIATFDLDGTLWVEQPMYAQAFFALDALGNSFLHKWGAESMALQKLEQLLSTFFFGIPLTSYQQKVAHWLHSALHPKFQKRFDHLIYQPMLEVINLLKNHSFTLYIVSGGGQEFIRVFSAKVFGIPPEHVIGSALKMRYDNENNHPQLVLCPQVSFIDDNEGKAIGIQRVIGKKPIAAFGNSNGDQQMLEWTQDPCWKAGKPRKTLQVLVSHDDDAREYAYADFALIGALSQELRNYALRNNWILVSIKNDWKTVFP